MNKTSITIAITILLIMVGGALFFEYRESQMEDSNDVPKSDVSDTPAPGTVRVKASVVSCDESASTCKLTVKTVRAYGMATPSISPGTPIPVKLGGYNSVRPGQTLSATLRSSQPKPPGSTTTDWTLINISSSR